MCHLAAAIVFIMIVCHVFSFFFLSLLPKEEIFSDVLVCVCKSTFFSSPPALLGHTVKDGNSLFHFRSKFSNEKFVHPKGWSWQSLIFRLLFCIFFFILENRTLPALFCLLSGAPQLPTHTATIDYHTVHVEIFLIVRSQSSFVSYRVRCDPTEKKSCRDRFLSLFVSLCVRSLVTRGYSTAQTQR